MWVSTFHSACVRILRREHDAAGLRSSFTIYDSADSLRLITNIAKDAGLDAKKNPPRALARRISSLKNELVDPIDFADQAESSRHPRPTPRSPGSTPPTPNGCGRPMRSTSTT
jgi:DNA helicase-2/ATP-dependent DNA helicase PcrA